MAVLSWFEHYTGDEVPPRWMWLDDEALNEHFDEVRSKHSSGDTDGREPVEDRPMMQNELTRGLRKRLREG